MEWGRSTSTAISQLGSVDEHLSDLELVHALLTQRPVGLLWIYRRWVRCGQPDTMVLYVIGLQCSRMVRLVDVAEDGVGHGDQTTSVVVARNGVEADARDRAFRREEPPVGCPSVGDDDLACGVSALDLTDDMATRSWTAQSTAVADARSANGSHCVDRRNSAG